MLALKRNDWKAALTVFYKLEKTQGASGPVLLMQGLSMMGMGETEKAMKLAFRSMAYPGSHRSHAKLLYAEGLFRQGDHRRAKDMYLSLHKTVTGELKDSVKRKIAACNRALKLPENDGIEE
jgi:hypothetical protein